MNEDIKQRIQYLIEHGGLWDDPLDDIRRSIRVNRILILVVSTLVLINLLEHLILRI